MLKKGGGGGGERERENSFISLDICACDQDFLEPTLLGGIAALRNASVAMAAFHVINTAPQGCFDLPKQVSRTGTESSLT